MLKVKSNTATKLQTASMLKIHETDADTLKGDIAACLSRPKVGLHQLFKADAAFGI
jgi:hypothetical protein